MLLSLAVQVAVPVLVLSRKQRTLEKDEADAAFTRKGEHCSGLGDISIATD